MKRYEIAWADDGTAKLAKLLDEGWEPFAVSVVDAFPDRYHLRRAKIVDGAA